MSNDVCGTRSWQKLAQENEMNENTKKEIELLEETRMCVELLFPRHEYDSTCECNKCRALTRIDKALSLIRSFQTEYELTNKFCDARYAAPETIVESNTEQSELQWAIDRIEELKPAELNEADKYDRIKLFLLAKEKEIHTRLETAEAEKEAARDLWINAQTACKKHALRADKAEAEIERLNEYINTLEEDIRNLKDDKDVTDENISSL